MAAATLSRFSASEATTRTVCRHGFGSNLYDGLLPGPPAGTGYQRGRRLEEGREEALAL